jgi:tripartite-type tricarboxylate transporter receptor subunit TctC
VAGGTGGEDAEGYPSDTVSLIMSYTAEGPAGLAAHSVASFMEKELGQGVAVETVLGALGAIGTTGMLSAGPTGISA